MPYNAGPIWRATNAFSTNVRSRDPICKSISSEVVRMAEPALYAGEGVAAGACGVSTPARSVEAAVVALVERRRGAIVSPTSLTNGRAAAAAADGAGDLAGFVAASRRGVRTRIFAEESERRWREEARVTDV